MEEYLDTLDILTESALDVFVLEMKKVFVEHDMNISDIKTKIYLENGTEEDIKFLCIAEAEDTNGKKDGIIATLIETIRKFFKSIKEAILGTKVDPKDIPDQGIKVNKDPSKLVEEQKGLVGILNKVLAGDKSALKKVGTVAATATGAIVLGKTLIEPTLKDLKTMADMEFSNSNGEGLDLSEEETGIFRKLIGRIKKNAIDAARITGQIKKLGSDEHIEVKGRREYAEDKEKRDNKKLKEAVKNKKKDEKLHKKEVRTNTLTEESIKERTETTQKMEENIREWIKVKENLISAIKNLNPKINRILSSGGFLNKIAGIFSDKKKTENEIAKYEKLMNKSNLSDSEMNKFMDLGNKIGSKHQEFKRNHALLVEMRENMTKLETRIKEAQEVFHKLKGAISEEDVANYLSIIRTQGFSKDINSDALINAINSIINKANNINESTINDFIGYL